MVVTYHTQLATSANYNRSYGFRQIDFINETFERKIHYLQIIIPKFKCKNHNS